MRISDWSSDVCSSDLPVGRRAGALLDLELVLEEAERVDAVLRALDLEAVERVALGKPHLTPNHLVLRVGVAVDVDPLDIGALRLRDVEVDPHRQRLARSEEHTSELQSLMRISYAAFCLKKKTKIPN